MDDDDIYMSDPRAKSIAGFIAGLQILAKHKEKGEAAKYFYFCGAEHDEIHLYADGDDIPEESEDGQALRALGFHLSGDTDCWAYFT